MPVIMDFKRSDLSPGSPIRAVLALADGGGFRLPDTPCRSTWWAVLYAIYFWATRRQILIWLSRAMPFPSPGRWLAITVVG